MATPGLSIGALDVCGKTKLVLGEIGRHDAHLGRVPGSHPRPVPDAVNCSSAFIVRSEISAAGAPVRPSILSDPLE